jgi:hypothetical protein
VTDPIHPIGERSGLPAVTPVQRRRPRDDEDDEQRREQEREEQRRRAAAAARAQPRRPQDPERLIDVEA